MLKSGAEIQRVEDTMERILIVGGITNSEAFATPTGLFASIHTANSKPITILRRINEHSIDLEKLTRANSLSREFVEGKISLEEGLLELEEINNLRSSSKTVNLLAYGVICFCFTALFGGDFREAVASFVCGVILGLFTFFLGNKNITPFLKSLISGSLVAVVSLIISYIIKTIGYEVVILGALMPLVPGVAITNAIRDIMNRDFLSGTSRIMEALIIAVSIAVGVGIIFSVLQIKGGG